MGGVAGTGLRIVAASLSLVVTMGAGVAVAVPPPPPNPSDAELRAGRADARAKATKVGQLTNQVAQAEAQLVQLQSDVELKMEDANRALVDLQAAAAAAARAKADAAAAKTAAATAAAEVGEAREQLDEFAAGSFKQGSTIGSMSAYIGSKSPEDLLSRAQLLAAVGESGLDALDDMDLARIDKANKDSAARKALDVASQKQAAAVAAKKAADTATAAARQARADQAAATTQLEARRDAAEAQLTAAQANASGLTNQRQRYLDWLAAKQAEEAGPRGGGGAVALPASGSVRAVIERALSQLGVQYAWGGGNAYGPTTGVRDGGIADAYGDYGKVGFDCSGLMIYAFAAAGKRLPHYSGYQAHAGRQVPLSQKAPGDMLFWATRGRIHHVALYLGNEQMIEAPYSGARVRITSVRYGGIVGFATRLL